MKKSILANQKIILTLFFLFLAGLFLRLYGINWDQGFYLNPDERFLTMTLIDLKLPQNFSEYLNPNLSPLNPYNMGANFFVYGTFPLALAKVLAVGLELDNYGQFFLVGRTLTSLLDASVILAVYLVSNQVFKNKKVALFGALIYAIAVFPIQQAHFFTVDIFANTFSIWSLVFILKSHRKIRYLLLSALFYALAIASKINTLYLAPLLLAILIINRPKSFFYFFVRTFSFGLFCYFFLRLFYPYLFFSPNWFNILPSLSFTNSIKQLTLLSIIPFYPPSIQWYHKGFFFPLKNIVLYGFGPTIALIFGLSLGYITKIKLTPKHKLIIFVVLLWSSLFYAYQSLQFAKTMRYYLILYFFISIFSGVCLYKLKKVWRALLIATLLIWTISFMHIYTVQHSRIAASNWMNQNLEEKSSILWEYWDDPLPLVNEKQFNLVKMEVFEKDTEQKMKVLNRKLEFADYLVLSSNRGWGTITKVPELYPQTSKYYQDLFKQKLGYKKIREFNSYPTLNLGFVKFVFNDSLADEAFSVYDHPTVMIFENTHSSF